MKKIPFKERGNIAYLNKKEEKNKEQEKAPLNSSPRGVVEGKNKNYITKKIGEKKEKNKKKGGIKIRLINVDGLTKVKYGELLDLFFKGKRNYNILCLTETHHNWERLYIDENLENFSAMRDIRDKTKGIKKGGGLKILMEKDKNMDFEYITCASNDILDLEGKCFNIDLKIILVYFDVDKGAKGKEINDLIRLEIEEKIKENKKEGLIILGDFNAHMEILEPDRKNDANGKMISDWCDKYDLILLNADEKCVGTYTRIRGTQKSAIDMVLVNDGFYKYCKDMNIDEKQEKLSFSDHNLISVTLRITTNNVENKFNGKKMDYGRSK
ncbi:unnamed protein product [Meganyctiphanes norvegica]|uniref:Endonuclease/exonuclease/phosphatase domain-containing protein n=1 Tax=Meganyctiphanes norvegica TaxID=48144 RepID=A0AAV2S3W5_MEGNR